MALHFKKAILFLSEQQKDYTSKRGFQLPLKQIFNPLLGNWVKILQKNPPQRHGGEMVLGKKEWRATDPRKSERCKFAGQVDKTKLCGTLEAAAKIKISDNVDATLKSVLL